MSVDGIRGRGPAFGHAGMRPGTEFVSVHADSDSAAAIDGLDRLVAAGRHYTAQPIDAVDMIEVNGVWMTPQEARKSRNMP